VILISHRGNISGKNPEYENKISYIQDAILKGYNCEIDVWYVDGDFYLGHDGPDYKINHNFLQNLKFWCHAKNIEALEIMLNDNQIHCFWHETDQYTITSNKYVWAYPGSIVTNKTRAICVLPELHGQNVKDYTGVCSDFVELYK
jgi:hypothetical protein